MKFPAATIAPQAYFQTVRDTFREHGDPVIAQGQMKYMKFHFEYFGLKMPVWMPLTKAFHRELGLPVGTDLQELVRLCFADEHREMQYFAMETVQLCQAVQPPEFIHFFEELILEKSWWDSVDWLAKLVGIHFKKYPEQILPITEHWMASNELWLQRTCLIFQRFYRDKTDADLLFEYVRRVSRSKEFFLQKGAGWALREYSKWNPDAVRKFIETTQLAPLTRREGLRLMNK